MISSKLARNGRATIPRAVRRALQLAAGDEISYRIEGDRVVLTKAAASAVGDPFAVFGEWSSEADRQAHAEL